MGKTVRSVTSAKKSGLILAPSRYRNKLSDAHYTPRCSATVHVYATAMIQTILSEILKASAVFCMGDKKRTIDRAHIHSAIRETTHLAPLFSQIDMPDTRVAENISAALVNIPKHRRAKKAPK